MSDDHRTAPTADPLLADRTLMATRLTGDRGAYGRLVDEAFLGIDADGAFNNRAQRLAEFDGLIYQELKLADHRARFAAPDVALVTARATLSATHLGRPIAGAFVYTNVWVWKPEGWRLLSSQATRVAA